MKRRKSINLKPASVNKTDWSVSSCGMLLSWEMKLIFLFSPLISLTWLTFFFFVFHTIFNRSIFPFFIRHKQQSQKLSGSSRRRRRVRTHPHPAFAQKKRRKFFVLFNIHFCKVCVRRRIEWWEYRNLRRCSTNVGSLIMTFGFNSSEPCRAERAGKKKRRKMSLRVRGFCSCVRNWNWLL